MVGPEVGVATGGVRALEKGERLGVLLSSRLASLTSNPGEQFGMHCELGRQGAARTDNKP
jgi:hypothetical protein